MASRALRVSLLCEPTGRPLLRGSPLVNVVRVLPNVVVALCVCEERRGPSRNSSASPRPVATTIVGRRYGVTNRRTDRLPPLFRKAAPTATKSAGRRGHDNRSPSPERHRADLKARRFPHGAEANKTAPANGPVQRANFSTGLLARRSRRTKCACCG